LSRWVATALLPLLAALIVLTTLLVVAALSAYTRPRLPTPYQLPERVERLPAHGSAPPAADATGWQVVNLPDRAPLDTAQPVQQAWYRLRFSGGHPPAQLQALLLQRPLAALSIWVNGQPLADSGVGRHPLPVYRTDLRYNLPPALGTAAAWKCWCTPPRNRVARAWVGCSSGTPRRWPSTNRSATGLKRRCRPIR
jgi:hypothetical protein